MTGRDEKYRSIFENAAEGIFQTTPDGRQLTVNRALARIYGYDSPVAMMATITDLGRQLYVRPQDRAEFVRLMEEQGAVCGWEVQYYRQDGSIIWVSENARAVHDARGELAYYEGTVEDITERKRVEDALRDSEGRFRRLAENAPDFIFRYELRPRRGFSYMSPAVTRMLGYTPEESYADPHFPLRLVHADDGRLKRTLLSGKEAISQATLRLRHKAGHTVWVEFHRVPVYGDDGALLAFEGIARDVSERVQAEERARRDANRLAEQAQRLALLEERERIAMDLHDGVIQSLYGVALGLGARDCAAAGPSGSADQVAALHAAIGLAIDQINGVIREIRDSVFDLRVYELGGRGLRAGLEALAGELRSNALLVPELDLAPAAGDLLDPPTVTHLLHLVQEAVSNVIRHARATAVAIGLTERSGRLALVVRDNGDGFVVRERSAADVLLDRGKGRGLRNMAQRARLAGGRLSVVSEPGRGTSIEVELPLPATRLSSPLPPAASVPPVLAGAPA